MKMKGVVVLFAVLTFLGMAAAENNDEWMVEPLESSDYLTFGSQPPDDGTLTMVSDPDNGFGATQYESSESEFSQYSQFFSMEAPSDSGIESYQLSRQPTSLYTSGPSGQAVAYSTYQSTYGGGNALWIMGTSSWTQYVTCPLGAYLRLLAYVPGGGTAEFYEIYPDRHVLYNSYWFNSGYTKMTFQADQIGRHILLFVANNQPSNVVVVDVTSGSWPPWPPSPGPVPGTAKITIRSGSITGYRVSVDGSYVGTEGQFGDIPDGVFNFTVSGDTYHSVQITSPGYTYIKGRIFNSGYHYTLNI